jgi:glycosyltransferase involved in cell wall biosynthesis
MSETGPKIALVYYDDAYLEPQAAAPGAAVTGVFGRHVAGKEFFDAYLTHGRWDDLVAVYSPPSATSLMQSWQSHPANRGRERIVQLVNEADFHQAFFPTPPASLVYLPCPPVARYAWMRQHGGPGAFALCGVTHSLCPASLVHDLCELVTAPYESYDALICTSRAAVQMVRAVTGTYADYLRERIGGTPALRVQLPQIPLGVNPDKFRPALPEERSAERRVLQVTEDEVAVLFVGRLSFHTKAHPFPMFQGIAHAARATGKKAHLLLYGWTSNPSVLNAFTEGGRLFAPGVRVSIVDRTNPHTRVAVWRAADLFTSFADNFQETFGLTVIEAMASGLPVIASDWDGYRDLVVPGETGLLVPTYMIYGATADVTARLVFGAIGYDQFMAETNQATVVDVAAAAEAHARLFADPALRQRLGAAGRKRVLEHFAWSQVVAAYEDLWRAQERERRAHVEKAEVPRQPGFGPASYPAPEESFAAWPTRWLLDSDRLEATTEARGLLEQAQTMPLTNYLDASRSNDARILGAVLDAAASPRELAYVLNVLSQAGVASQAARATVAWMLKYGLLRVVI